MATTTPTKSSNIELQATELRNISPFRDEVKKTLSFIDNDFVCFDDNDPDDDHKAKLGQLPRLLITEFQPDFNINLGDIVDEVVEGAEGGIKAIGNEFLKSAVGKFASTISSNKNTAGGVSAGSKILGSLIGAGAKTVAATAGEEYTNNLIKNSSNNTEEGKKNLLETPVNLVENMISGKYIRKFILPYFGHEYLQASGNNGWSSSGIEKVIGNKLRKFVSNGLPMDFPGVPEWNNSSGGNDCPVVTFELKLINNNLANAAKNFNFIQTFTAGAFWIQIDKLQRSPNLYIVECPGRFYHLYSTMDCKVNYYGKSRLIDGKILTDFKSLLNKQAGDINLLNGKFWIPDAYVLNISLKSLMPNNFNMQLAYMLGKFKAQAIGNTNLVTTGIENKSALSRFASAAGGSIGTAGSSLWGSPAVKTVVIGAGVLVGAAVIKNAPAALSKLYQQVLNKNKPPPTP